MGNNNMTKPGDAYRLYVFDLDGTLYFQKPLRLKMAWFLVKSAIKKPSNIKRILIVSDYRKMRETWTGAAIKDLEYQQYKAVADKNNCAVDYVRQAIHEFMFDAPLPFLKKYKDERLAGIITSLREQGKRVVVYSDYPVDLKLKALGIEVDNMYCAFDEEIGSLKPGPEGLSYILRREGFDAKEALMIGDRFEKDAQSAINNGMDYLVLSSKREKRDIVLAEIFGNYNKR